MEKVVLAFSGGLDTSFAVPYLKDQGYEVITATVDTGGFSPTELSEIEAQSKRLGAASHYEIDGRRSMFDKIGSYIIKTNGLYENSYPNMCSDRYIIAEESVRIARQIGSSKIAHGSSAMGNDQVRFDVALMGIAPEMDIIAPIRDTGGDRDKQLAYMEDKGFPVESRNKKYSVNQNILGITYSGSEIDALEEADESMFLWTKPTGSSEQYVDLRFQCGVPVGLNGEYLYGEDILNRMNKIAGSHGFGRGYYTGDCIVGIKGRIAFEAPGVLALIKAHMALEQLVHTKAQYMLGKIVTEQFAELVYSGKFYDPAVEDIKRFVDSQQKHVTGNVQLKLNPNQVQAVAVSSPNSLIDHNVANYAQSSSWSPAEANGFIKLYGLQNKLAAARKI